MQNITVEKFIETIKTRPSMFVSSETIAELDGLLRGYLYARKTLLNIAEQEEEVFREFAKWLIAEKYNAVSGLDLSWRSILLLFHVSESVAFKKFFYLWDEFQNSRKTKE